jgi:hypothetical protein
MTPEVYRRLKHRPHPEAVSGLSQQAVIIDVAAKILVDNLTSLMCDAAVEHADPGARQRKCNRSYAASVMQHPLLLVLLFIGNVRAAIIDAIHAQLTRNSQCLLSGRSQPRPPRQLKPHPSRAYKGRGLSSVDC